VYCEGLCTQRHTKEKGEAAFTWRTARRSGGLWRKVNEYRRSHSNNVERTTGFLRKAVDRIVALAHCADRAAQRERRGRVECAAVGIDIGNADLNRRVILGSDQAVCAQC